MGDLATEKVAVPAQVVSGRGIAGRQSFLDDPQLAALLGQRPFPGTLNLILDRPVEFDLSSVLTLNRGRALFWPANFMGRACVVHRWTRCPLHVAEVISDIRLRDEIAALAGRPVLEIEARPLPRYRLAAWTRLWQGHEDGYYSDDGHLARIRRHRLARYLSQQRIPRPWKALF